MWPGDHQGELTEAPALLARLPLSGRVVTGDALYCQRTLCQQIQEAGGDYVVIIKDNYPTLRAAIRSRVGTVPVGVAAGRTEQTTRHGGRVEERRMTVAYADDLPWPGVGIVGEVVCEVTHRGRTTTQARTVLTSLGAHTTAAQVLWLVRGHWQIENRLHYVRDVTLLEDRSRLRAGAAPQVMAALRNVVLGLLRATAATNIAAARRAFAWSGSALSRLGWSPTG